MRGIPWPRRTSKFDGFIEFYCLFAVEERQDLEASEFSGDFSKGPPTLGFLWGIQRPFKEKTKWLGCCYRLAKIYELSKILSFFQILSFFPKPAQHFSPLQTATLQTRRLKVSGEPGPVDTQSLKDLKEA